MALLDDIRFRLDEPSLYRIGTRSADDLQSNVQKYFSLRHVKITDALFPGLAACIARVFETLRLSHEYQAYVSADETLNAACVASKDGPIIWLSSGLVKTLEENELGFVLGHEVGHWYLEHHLYDKNQDPAAPDYRLTQSLSRAAEISADRFGLIAVGDIDIALRAIVKTASGLPEEFFGSSLSDYLRQVRDVKDLSENVSEVYSSHPPMVTRARALLWFSMSQPYNEISGGPQGGDSMETVDDRVEADLNRALGFNYVANREEDLRHQIFWTVVDRLGSDGRLDKGDQETVVDCFGKDYLDKLIGMISGLPRNRVQAELRTRAQEAASAFRTYSRSEINQYLEKHTAIRDALREHKISLG